MKYFLYKLIPPRSTFAKDMTREEKNLMDEHFAYWSNLMDRWCVIAFGPVEDSTGGYGIAILEADNDTDIEALGHNDPMIKAGAGFHFEICPMPQVVLRM